MYGMEDEIQRLRDEVAFLRGKDGLALRELARANRAEAELQRLRGRGDAPEGQEDTLLYGGEVGYLRGELRAALATIEQLRETCQRLYVENTEELAVEVERLRKDHNYAVKEVERLRAEVADVQRSYTKLGQRCLDAEADAERLRAARDDVQDILHDLGYSFSLHLSDEARSRARAALRRLKGGGK